MHLIMQCDTASCLAFLSIFSSCCCWTTMKTYTQWHDIFCAIFFFLLFFFFYQSEVDWWSNNSKCLDMFECCFSTENQQPAASLCGETKIYGLWVYWTGFLVFQPIVRKPFNTLTVVRIFFGISTQFEPHGEERNVTDTLITEVYLVIKNYIYF